MSLAHSTFAVLALVWAGALDAQIAPTPLRDVPRPVPEPQRPVALNCRDTAAARPRVLPVYDTLPRLTELDRPPRLLRSPRPRVPPGMAGVPGRVLLTFVVAIDGRAAPCSANLISGTNSLFVAAAVEMLENTRFAPAERDGRPVAAWAQQGFSWSSAGFQR